MKKAKSNGLPRRKVETLKGNATDKRIARLEQQVRNLQADNDALNAMVDVHTDVIGRIINLFPVLSDSQEKLLKLYEAVDGKTTILHDMFDSVCKWMGIKINKKK